MGKWTHIKGKYDKLVTGEEGYLAKVNLLKRSLAHNSKEDLLGFVNDLEQEKKRLESQLAEISPQLQAVQELVMEDMEARNEESVKHEIYGTFTPSVEPFASYEDKEKFIQWLKETGKEDILGPNWNTVNAMVKEALENGQNPPPGIKVYIKWKLKRRRKTGA